MEHRLSKSARLMALAALPAAGMAAALALGIASNGDSDSARESRRASGHAPDVWEFEEGCGGSDDHV